MIEVYAFATPNSVKVPIALEELGLPYVLHGVNVRKGEQFEQLFLHASGLGPAFGNAGYFQRAAPEPVGFAIERYQTEAARVLKILDQILAHSPFIAGSQLTIADIAHFGWLWRREFAGIDLSATPHVARYVAELEARPAFQRAIARCNALVPTEMPK